MLGRLAPIVVVFAITSPAVAEGWKAGVAAEVVTPKQSTWMAGYAARKGPSEGTLHDLWAKAVVLEDPAGTRAAIVSLDLCGIDRDFSKEVRGELAKRYGMAEPRVILACSHTHSGPVVGTNLRTMYPLDEEQNQRIDTYTKSLHDAIVAVVGRAVADLAPASLGWETGRADFAVNRRNNDQGKVPELRAKLALNGPMDFDVPVLKVAGQDSKLRAVVFGYACHCTTLQGMKFSGDYAGYAMLDLERAHPGAKALFIAGCGADQNPLPRGEVKHAERYGKELAEAVEHVLSGPLRPISGKLLAAYEEIPLEFAPIPDRPFWEAQTKSANVYEAARARKLVEQIDKDGKLSPSYPYPVQHWTLGDGPTWVFLGGEVVVDYALRVKRNRGDSRTWVSAYCNDVMGYIPSLRVLKEGGYEGGGAMVYYAQPGPWSEKVEEQIIGALARQLEQAPW